MYSMRFCRGYVPPTVTGSSLKIKLELWFIGTAMPIYPPHHPDLERVCGWSVVASQEIGDGDGGDDGGSGDGHHHSYLPLVSFCFVSVVLTDELICPSLF